MENSVGEEPPVKKGSIFKRIFFTILLLIFFLVILFIFVLSLEIVSGNSMSPNVLNHEYLLSSRLIYRFSSPRRGDIVIFSSSIGYSSNIARVIGMPGEKISISNGDVYINGQVLKEPYLLGDIKTRGATFLEEGKSVNIPAGEYFVLGDNRSHSSDSRYWGFVKKSAIVKKPFLVYWPTQRARFLSNPYFR